VHCAALNEALTAEVHRLKLATGEVTADGNGMPKSLQQQMNSQMVQLQQLQIQQLQSTQGQQGEQQQQPQKSA
jgi:hypothetical protein